MIHLLYIAAVAAIVAAGTCAAAALRRRVRGAPRQKLPMLFQAESAECSLACLAMVATFHGRHTTVSALRQMHPVSLQGLSLRTVMRIGETLGLRARAIRCDVPQLRRLRLPALLHFDADHFVVLSAASRRRFSVHNPARGIERLTAEEMSNHFSGVVLELTPDTAFQRTSGRERLTLFQLIRSAPRLHAMVAQILAVSLALEVMVLTQPLLLRKIVDVGVSSGDPKLLPKIIGVLLLVAGAVALTSFLRDYAVLRSGTSINSHLAQGLLRHTLRLPLPFFEKRPIGHLIERYRTVDEVERFLVAGLPLAVIDGIMTCLALGMLLMLAPALGLLALATVVVFYGIKSVTHGPARSREEKLVWAKGEENGHLIETLRTILTTKASGIESTRLARWTGLYHARVVAQRQLGILDVAHRSGKHAVVGINVAALVAIAAPQIAAGSLTVGTLLAVLVYNSQFLVRSTLLVERVFEYRLLNVRLERLEDLVFTRPEAGPAHDAGASARLEPTGAIVVENVAFGYGGSTAPVLEDASFRIEPGELVAVVGDNGAGKTTLMKMLLGLYKPAAGRVLYDGADLAGIPTAILRAQIGVVTQDDQLLTGTVAENIALFDPDMDLVRVVAAAELACVHAEIEKMPMGYSTRVGDLGSPFSEGQKQKIFLARGLYRQPSVLLMDEGTANVDSRTEQKILSNLAGLRATKILIAHRQATVRHADRVLLVKDGRVTELLGGARRSLVAGRGSISLDDMGLAAETD